MLLIWQEDTDGEAQVTLFLVDVSDKNNLTSMNINEQQKPGETTRFEAKSDRLPNKIIISTNDEDLR